MTTKSSRNIVSKSIYLLFIVLVFSNCKPVVHELPIENSDLVISQFIELNKDYSEFNKLLKNTGLDNMLSIRGPYNGPDKYTLFLPTNSAMLAYYAEKNVTSFTGLDTLAQKELVLNHIVPKEFTISLFQLGALPSKNAIGDNIVTEFQGSDIIINKYAKIIKRDTKVSNGTIQIIDKVLDPLKLTVIRVLAANPSYSIFTEGLRRTGIADTLDEISFKFGQKDARIRYTILAVADTTFKRYGINNIDELIKKYSNTSIPDSLKKQSNGFYEYMDFHCLDKNSNYLSDFPDAPTLYSVLSKNYNLQIRVVSGVYKINYNDNDSSYTGFYIEQSDIPAKNGVIHTINKLLEVSTPAPTVIIWETTDYFDLKQGEYYLNHFQKFFDTSQFAGIKWHGDFLQYYLKASGAPAEINSDCLNMNGWWDIEVTTPKIMKGKYIVAGRIWTGGFRVYIDGIETANIKLADVGTITGHYSPDASSLLYKLNLNDAIIWTTSSEHKIKLVSTLNTLLFWDRVEFIPVN